MHLCDVDDLIKDVGFKSSTPIDEGLHHSSIGIENTTRSKESIAIGAAQKE